MAGTFCLWRSLPLRRLNQTSCIRDPMIRLDSMIRLGPGFLGRSPTPKAPEFSAGSFSKASRRSGPSPLLAKAFPPPGRLENKA
jgi:hypothetical protein